MFYLHCIQNHTVHVAIFREEVETGNIHIYMVKS